MCGNVPSYPRNVYKIFDFWFSGDYGHSKLVMYDELFLVVNYFLGVNLFPTILIEPAYLNWLWAIEYEIRFFKHFYSFFQSLHNANLLVPTVPSRKYCTSLSELKTNAIN